MAVSEETTRLLSPDVPPPHLYILHWSLATMLIVGVALEYLTTLHYYSDFKCNALANAVDIVLGKGRIIQDSVRALLIKVLVRA